MMEENSKARQNKLRKPLYDDKEFTEFLEMVRGFRAYSKVRHDKHLTTGLMLWLQRTLRWTSLNLWVRLICRFKDPWWISLDLWVRFKNVFLKVINHSNGCASPAFESNILAGKALIRESGSWLFFEKPWWFSSDLWVRLKDGFLNAINHSNGCISLALRIF